MYKKIIYRLLAVFLFVFIFVTFLIPSDLVAEIRKFWVDTSHWGTENVWVTSGHFQDTWVDTSHNVLVTSGYFQDTKKERWVDTSHMVYQGYWNDVTKSVWVDTSQWVSSGSWKDVIESVWVEEGHTERTWIDTSHNVWVEDWTLEYYWVDTSYNLWVTSGHTERTWVDTSHNVWVSSGYYQTFTGSRWIDTSHNVWVSEGHTEYYWVDTSHNVWVSSGYTASRWVDTSHWEARQYYDHGWKTKYVWISSGYTAYYWVDTSHNVWVSSGYTASRWVDTSHNVWVSSGYWKSYTYSVWIDTSHYAWLVSGYFQDTWMDTSHYVWFEQGYVDHRLIDSSHWAWLVSGYFQDTWVDTSHWEDQKVWVDTTYYDLGWRYVEDWQPCDVTFVDTIQSIPWYFIGIFGPDTECDHITRSGTINGKMYKFTTIYYYYFPTIVINTTFLAFPYCVDKVLYKIKYECYEVLNWKKEAYGIKVEGGHWKKEWVDTSHWVPDGYWQSFTYRTWVDTSYMVESGYWEDYTTRTWVDTSHNVLVTDGHTERTWVDTSHYETRDVWVEDGYYTSPLHGEVIVEKSPRYIFTRWHKNQNNEECSMELNVSWKVDNNNLSEGEEEKEIVRIYIYQDICRFNNNGVEKVIIFNGNVTPSVEGSINTITKFDYSGTEESILHIYLYAQNGESAHVYFNNPINGFRSLNLMSEGSNSDANTWLGGYNYGKFEF